MRVLAIESSAKPASCAVLEYGRLIGEFFTNAGFTHSQTIMPMVKGLLESLKLSAADIDLFAVAAGPGSFTGLRIGLSAVKGLAFACGKPCAAVSSLEALAHNLCGFEGTACCVMDARCGQVYTALFELSDGKVSRISEDCAISIEELFEQIRILNKTPVFFVGDGAELCYNRPDKPETTRLAPPALRFQRASSVGAVASREGFAHISADELTPIYLRLPQAERELQNRAGGNNDSHCK